MRSAVRRAGCPAADGAAGTPPPRRPDREVLRFHRCGTAADLQHAPQGQKQAESEPIAEQGWGGGGRSGRLGASLRATHQVVPGNETAILGLDKPVLECCKSLKWIPSHVSATMTKTADQEWNGETPGTHPRKARRRRQERRRNRHGSAVSIAGCGLCGYCPQTPRSSAQNRPFGFIPCRPSSCDIAC